MTARTEPRQLRRLAPQQLEHFRFPKPVHFRFPLTFATEQVSRDGMSGWGG
jgi:hypothetical protein